MQHSEGGTITTPSLQMGSKFREARTLPEATQQASAAELGCSGSGKCSQKVPLGPTDALTTPGAPTTPPTPPP